MVVAVVVVVEVEEVRRLEGVQLMPRRRYALGQRAAYAGTPAPCSNSRADLRASWTDARSAPSSDLLDDSCGRGCECVGRAIIRSFGGGSWGACVVDGELTESARGAIGAEGRGDPGAMGHWVNGRHLERKRGRERELADHETRTSNASTPIITAPLRSSAGPVDARRNGSDVMAEAAVQRSGLRWW
ncbi:MAG: hypothetical protein Q9159_002969 [Coniocarpon cinnabarinum]